MRSIIYRKLLWYLRVILALLFLIDRVCLISGLRLDSDLLNLHLALESRQDVIPLDTLDLLLLVMVHKVLDLHVAAADLHSYLVALLDLNVNFPLSKLVHALRLS